MKLRISDLKCNASRCFQSKIGMGENFNLPQNTQSCNCSSTITIWKGGFKEYEIFCVVARFTPCLSVVTKDCSVSRCVIAREAANCTAQDFSQCVSMQEEKVELLP